MHVKAYFKDKTSKEFERYDNNVAEFILSIEGNIQYIVFTNSYSIGDKGAFDGFTDKIENLNGEGSVKMRIDNINEYTFDLILEGNPLDVVIYDEHLNPRHIFNVVDKLMENDRVLLDSLLRGISLHNFSTNSSLILRFLSDKNGGIEYQQVLDILRKEVSSQILKDFLPTLFKELYKVDVEKTRTRPLEADKMSLRAIQNDVIEQMEKEIELILA